MPKGKRGGSKPRGERALTATERGAQLGAARYASGLRQIKVWGARDFPPALYPLLQEVIAWLAADPARAEEIKKIVEGKNNY